MSNRKRPIIALLMLPMVWGLISLIGVMNGPGFESMRFLDIVRLLTAGFGFGATFTGLIFTLVKPPA